MGDSVKNFTKVKINNLPPSYLITESDQVHQAWFSLHISVLTALGHLLLLHMFGNGFQDDLLHALCRLTSL